MNKLYRDVFQYGMKAGNYFLGYHMPEYIFGSGVGEGTASCAERKGRR